MVYLFLVLIFLVPIVKKHEDYHENNDKYYWFECVCLILVGGLRNQVGGDTFGYMTDWDFMPSLKELNASSFLITRYRPIWILINAVAKTISDQFFVLQMIESCFINICTFFIIKHESNEGNKFFITLIYLVSSFLYLNCEILREAFCVGLFYIAFIQLLKHKYIYYYLLVIIAYFIHDSSFYLLLFPLLIKILNKEITLKTIFVCFAISVIISLPWVEKLWIQLLPGTRGETFLGKYGNMEIGSVLGIIRSIVFVGLDYYLLKIEKGRLSKLTEYGLKMYLILHIFGIVMPILTTRICNYFNIFFYIAIADAIIANMNVRRSLSYLYIAMICFSSYRYYFMNVTSWVTSSSNYSQYYFYERFYPYYSIFEEPDQGILTRRIAIYHQEEVNSSYN